MSFMSKSIYAASATAMLLLSAPAVAQVGPSYSSDPLPGSPPANATRITFDSPLPNGFSLQGGRIVSGSTEINAAPFGNATNYLTTDIGNATLFTDRGYSNVGFDWGSVGSTDSVDFLDQVGAIIGRLTSADVAGGPADFDRVDPNTNRYVTFSVDPQSGQLISAVSLNSTGYALETDNFNFYDNANGGGGAGPTPVPEPGTLALFGLGAGLLAAHRRRRKAA